jgi:hypothetical protein
MGQKIANCKKYWDFGLFNFERLMQIAPDAKNRGKKAISRPIWGR